MSVIRSSHGSLLQREENNGLSSAASRKPTWCLALRIIAWLTHKRIGTVPLRRIGALPSSNSTEQLLRYNFSATENSEKKYQFEKSASGVQKFSLSTGDWQSKL
jgi:hypothetical protein